MSNESPSSAPLMAAISGKPRHIPFTNDCFDCPGAASVRQALRGMESELVDLVLEKSYSRGWMDWLRVPLECATTTGRLDAVKRLLAAGVDTSIPQRRPMPGPLLHVAAAAGNAGVVCELLKSGVDVDEMDKTRHDRTALHSAAAAGAEDAVLALVRAGANVEARDSRGFTPLHLAAKLGHRGVVVFLLLKGAQALRTTLPEGDTALHLAASSNHAGVIEDLVVLGKACVACPNVKGQTALHIAARGCHLEACIALLRAGSAVGRVNSQGLSCLDIAAWNGHTGRLLQVLTAAEPTVNRKRKCSLALYYAAKVNKPQTILDLVELGADVDHSKSGGMTNLHFTAARGADAAAEALLRAGADLEARSQTGDTPLHRACSFSQPGTVRLLLRWGADEMAKNVGDLSPWDVVGSTSANPDAITVAGPDEAEDKVVREMAIRKMLKSAPADRVWRRRSWIVMCRARWMTRVGAKIRITPDSPDKPSSPQPPLLPAKRSERGSGGSAALAASRRPRASITRGMMRFRNGGATGGAVLVLGRDSVLNESMTSTSVLEDEKAEVRSGREEENARFLRAVERLLLLREEGVFREVVAFL